MLFKKGQSGNPKGRPPGTTKASVLRDELEKHRPDLLAKVVAMALEGDTTAIRLCLERIIPPLKSTEAPVILTFPEGATLVEKGDIILRTMAEGELPPDTASRLLSALASQAKLVETEELELRIRALEQSHVAS